LVERLCPGRPREATYVHAKGRFSFNLGVVDSEATANQKSASLANASDMQTCSIRASLAGYHPQTIALDGVVKAQKTNLGELVLQPIGRQVSAVMSVTDTEVPKNSRKDYEAGLDAAAKS
jgi:hypothetical protein